MAKYPDVTAGQTEACINRMGGWGNFLRFIGGAGEIVFKSILTFIRDFLASAHPKISTSEKFWEDAGVKWMGDNFKTQFLRLEVAAASAATLSLQKLEENSLDTPILSELGEKAETSVLHFAEFLNQNRRSSEFFIGYLRGLDGNLFAVCARWFVSRGGWRVDARSVASPFEWGAGGLVCLATSSILNS